MLYVYRYNLRRTHHTTELRNDTGVLFKFELMELYNTFVEIFSR